MELEPIRKGILSQTKPSSAAGASAFHEQPGIISRLARVTRLHSWPSLPKDTPLYSSCITQCGTERHPDSGCLKYFCPFLPLSFFVPFFNNDHLSEIVYNHFLKHFKSDRFNITATKLTKSKHMFQNKHERLNC